MDEELKWKLFRHEQKGEIEKIAIQKRKDEYIQQQQQRQSDEQHRRLLGQQSLKEYTSKMDRLKKHNGMRETVEGERLIDIEEEEDDDRKEEDTYEFRDRWSSGWL